MKNLKVLVEEFQCPGCGLGSDTGCGHFKPFPWDGQDAGCQSHSPGTVVFPGGKIFLGLPRGFNKCGPSIGDKDGHRPIIFHETIPTWNNFNVPVWAMEKKNYLFIRWFSPRVNETHISVIPGGKISDLPASVIDVGKFYDEID